MKNDRFGQTLITFFNIYTQLHKIFNFVYVCTIIHGLVWQWSIIDIASLSRKRRNILAWESGKGSIGSDPNNFRTIYKQSHRIFNLMKAYHRSTSFMVKIEDQYLLRKIHIGKWNRLDLVSRPQFINYFIKNKRKLKNTFKKRSIFPIYLQSAAWNIQSESMHTILQFPFLDKYQKKRRKAAPQTNQCSHQNSSPLNLSHH